jgi:hypothetical protein
LKEFDWFGTAGANSLLECLFLTSFTRFCQVTMLLAVVSVMMLNAFFLKTLLWIPPPHYLNIIRLLMWYLSAPLGVLEYHRAVVPNTDCVGDSVAGSVAGSVADSAGGHGPIAAIKRMPHCLLCTVAIFLEASVCLKVSYRHYRIACFRLQIDQYAVCNINIPSGVSCSMGERLSHTGFQML